VTSASDNTTPTSGASSAAIDARTTTGVVTRVASTDSELVIDRETGLVVRPDPARFPWGPTTVASLLDEPLASSASKLALIDGDRTWTYSELDAAVAATAGALAASGIRAGDRVAWSLANCAELPIGFLACQRLAAIWVGINQRFAAPERAHLLEDAQVSLLVEAERTAMPGPPSLTVEELNDAIRVGHEPPDVDINPHAPAAIAYTSGTSGLPKGAVHSQHNLIWQGLSSRDSHPPSDNERLGTPLSHTILNMMVLGPLSAFARGTTSVVMTRTDAAGFSDEVKAHELTFALLVPTILHDLVNEPDLDPSALATLRHVIVGGAGAPTDLRAQFQERFGVRPILSYGLSEAPSGVARELTNHPVSQPAEAIALAPVELVVVDGNDEALAADTEGEICIRAVTDGPWAKSWTPMLGYWRKSDLTANTLRHGLLHTGDFGVLDRRGRLRVRGRLSDLIIRGGANIVPAEIERVLMEHDAVAEAVVFGVPDDRLGQRVAAAVISQATGSVGSEDAIEVGDALIDPWYLGDDLRDHCATSLARFKVPDAIVVLDALPRNAMGKVAKPELIELVAPALVNQLNK